MGGQQPQNQSPLSMKEAGTALQGDRYSLLLLSDPVVSDSLQLHRLPQARLPCPSLSPKPTVLQLKKKRVILQL